jgi:hypothetical protein
MITLLGAFDLPPIRRSSMLDWNVVTCESMIAPSDEVGI